MLQNNFYLIRIARAIVFQNPNNRNLKSHATRLGAAVTVFIEYSRHSLRTSHEKLGKPRRYG